MVLQELCISDADEAASDSAFQKSPMDTLEFLADYFAKMTLQHHNTPEGDNFRRIAEGVVKALNLAKSCITVDDEELKMHFKSQAEKVCALMKGDEKIQMQEAVSAF